MSNRTADIARIQHSVSVLVRSVRSQSLGKYVAGRVGVSFGELYYGLLPYIHRSQPVRVSDLAQLVQLETATVSRHVATLSRQGIVSRHQHPDDGRAVLVRLTPKGESIYEATLSSWVETIDDVIVDWDDAKAHAFADHMAAFSELLDRFVSTLSGEVTDAPTATGES